MHGPMISIQEHSYKLSQHCAYVYYSEFIPIVEWLQIAAGVEKIEYYSDRYDESAQYCGPALEYERKKSTYQSKVIKQLVIFSFVWNAFESLLENVKFKPCSHRSGKINEKIRRVIFF